MKNKFIWFVLLSMLLVAFSSCNDTKKDGELEYSSATAFCYSSAGTIENLLQEINKANSGEKITENNIDVTRFLKYEPTHSDGSKCKKIEVLIPNLNTESYRFYAVHVFEDRYQYLYSYAENSPHSSDIRLIISKYTNVSEFEDSKYFQHKFNSQDYYIQIDYRADDITDYESHTNSIFSFETQTIRECEICKVINLNK